MPQNNRNIIRKAKRAKRAYCKFLDANDVIQMEDKPAGIYIAKQAQEILFEYPMEAGVNKERVVNILWQDDIMLQNKFIYYGKRIRNEYCITQFPEKFPYVQEKFTGSLFLLIEEDSEHYLAYMIEEEERIQDVLEHFLMSPVETDRMIQNKNIRPFALERFAIDDFLKKLNGEMPDQQMLSEGARRIYHEIYNFDREEINMPDKLYLSWLDMENRLYYFVEHTLYEKTMEKKRYSLEEFLEIAEEIVEQRRKRIESSVLNHLKQVFYLNKRNGIIGEQKEKKCLEFPVIRRDEKSEEELKWILNVRILCKGTWEQGLRKSTIDQKTYLFTLQQGLPKEVLKKMWEQDIRLVIPAKYMDCYPAERKCEIFSIAEYLDYMEVFEKS